MKKFGATMTKSVTLPIVGVGVAATKFAMDFSDAGTTERVPETMVGVEEKEGYLIPVPKAVTVSDLARNLNAIGATPRDLVAIFNALKRAGALQARLVIM